ncbi:MAG: hypothetical protein ACLFQY_04655 [Desulfococcaceae bacterium]
MPGNNRFRILLILLPPALFLAGVVHLFQLRFQTGDVYPVYSSLRSDPLGTRAFYEGLNRLDGVTAERGYRDPGDIESGDGVTYFFPGYPLDGKEYFKTGLLDDVEEIVRTGGRVIISFHPEKTRPKRKKRKKEGKAPIREAKPDSENPDGPGKQSEPPKDSEEKTETFGDEHTPMGAILLHREWDLALKYPEDLKTGIARRADNQDGGILPSTLPLHTILSFDLFQDQWSPIYTRNGYPVMVERPMGRGTLVLSAGTYFMSNEAMLKDRRPGLLAWLMGPNTRAVFNETHLGIREDPGITHLVRKYNLHGLAWGILLVVGLFVWKNSTCFVPPADRENPESGDIQVAARRNYTEGLFHLLRRHIPRQKLLQVCWEEWEKAAAAREGNSGPTPDTRRQVQETLSAETFRSDPAAGYRRIQELLSETRSLSRKP